MEGFDHKEYSEKHDHTDAGAAIDASAGDTVTGGSKGSSIQSSELDESLDQALTVDEHDHAPDTSGNSSKHAALSDVSVVKTLSSSGAELDQSLNDDVGERGDFLDAKGGKNTVIGSVDADVIVGTGGGLNTITTGSGRDTIVLGAETTNRIFDFDAKQDRLAFASNLDLNNIVVAQGKDPGKGGLDQPLDSENNTLVIDKSTEHILASLTFTKASDVANGSFRQIDDAAFESFDDSGFNAKEGGGQLTGTRGRDKLVGDGGDNFLYVGDDGFQVGKTTAKGSDEFPFPNDSPGTSEATGSLQGGTLNVNGTYQNFDGAPLFSQGETTADENSIIFSGNDKQALIDNFASVPQDSEGNKLSGTHLHFSPSGDSRGNFADATVVRYFDNTVNEDGKSGAFSGQFKLNSEEQAAFLAGNLYANIHTNIDVDGDGKGGFLNGENRLNFNQEFVKFV